jgi:hypothetical protein
MKHEAGDQGSRFVGWHCINSRRSWQRMVSAESETECWAILELNCNGGQMIVLPAYRRPVELKHDTVGLKHATLAPRLRNPTASAASRRPSPHSR